MIHISIFLSDNIHTPRRCRHNVAKKAHDAAEASAIMRGDDPASVPAVKLVKIGGVMLPRGPGLNTSARRTRLLAPWGTNHPANNDTVSQRVAYSTDELLFIQRAIQQTKSAFPAALDVKLAARVLKIIHDDPAARAVFHQKHIADSGRMRTGIQSLQALEGAGKPIVGRNRQRKLGADEDEEDEEDEGKEAEEEEEAEEKEEQERYEEELEDKEEEGSGGENDNDNDDDDEVDEEDEEDYDYDVQQEGQDEEGAEWSE
jgi:hypothetical protein